jgi:branched-chain amino acid transport system substrate-binding protein
MKKITTLLFLLLIGPSAAFAQTFEVGLDFYQQGDYERALRIFEQTQTPEAQLFAGKSHFALNNYLRAISYFDQVSETAPVDIYHEAIYTKALAKFQIEDYASSLDILKALGETRPSSPTTSSAIMIYDQVLGFLTLGERREVFRESESDEVRLDVLEASVGKVKYQSALTLFNIFKQAVPNYDDLRVNRIETILSDSVTYQNQYNPNRPVTAPKGISYNLGVLLPEFEYNTQEYEIPQHLYYGIQLAVEEFNSENADQKVFITHKSTNKGIQDADENMTELVWNDDVDFILGPLFSEVAREYAHLAEAYEVPMLLPLANADSLDLYNDFVFQLNPTFESQGKVMADYAVNVLGYDTLGVIAEARSLGSPAARAFLREAEKNGAFVRYYFEENLEEFGYDIRDYTKFFTTDTLDSVDIVKAVYAPFTGTVAPTLVESMLTDLEAMRSDVHILGSEEWMNVDLESRRLPDTELYYTESFNVDTSEVTTGNFASSFRLRFNTEPNQFAYIGYDAASVVLDVIKRTKNPAYIREELKNIRGFEGLSIDISFDGGHVNKDIRVVRKERVVENEFLPPEERRRR